MTDAMRSRGPREPTIRDRLEQVVDRVVGKGLYWAEVSAEFEKLFILRALKLSNGNIMKAAELMGVHRNTLSKKIRLHRIRRSDVT
jgi:transcriptional regulator of acetoin/glycerol metabolism